MIGYAFCGSFCTLSRSLDALRQLKEAGYDLQPFMSERVFSTDTRFMKAADLRTQVEQLCGRPIVHTVEDAEPYGPKHPLRALIVAPCTGNTLAKVAAGITDGTVPMVIKAHLRADRPTLLALATNDAMSQNLQNLARLLTRRGLYFVPMKQDDPIAKPHSLVARFEDIPRALDALFIEQQLRPLFV